MEASVGGVGIGNGRPVEDEEPVEQWRAERCHSSGKYSSTEKEKKMKYREKNITPLLAHDSFQSSKMAVGNPCAIGGRERERERERERGRERGKEREEADKGYRSTCSFCAEENISMLKHVGCMPKPGLYSAEELYLFIGIHCST